MGMIFLTTDLSFRWYSCNKKTCHIFISIFLGIGRAIAKKLSESGAIVFALSRSPEHLITLSAEAPNVKPVEVDLSNWDETKKVVEEVGPVDLLVNNAAISILEPFLEMHPESFDKVHDIAGSFSKLGYNIVMDVMDLILLFSDVFCQR